MNLKKVERAWKAGALGAACLVMRATGSPAPVPDWRAQATRILFLRQDRIGDAIVSSGLLRAIKAVSPGLTIDALASPRNAEILRRDPSITSVHLFDKRRPGGFSALTRELRRARYDAVLDCMVTAPSMTGLMLMLASGARHRIGIAGRGIDAGLTIPVPPTRDSEHIIDLLAAFAQPFGIDRAAVDWRPSLELSESERAEAERRWAVDGEGQSRRLLINTSAGHPDRYWPDDLFVATISRLRQRFRDLQTVVIGGPQEWDRTASIAKSAGVHAMRTPGLADAIGLVATADYVLTPDTSVAHMACAFCIPAVVMYKDAEAVAQWGLYDSPGFSIPSDGSLARLPLERVLAELERIVGGR